MRILFEGEEHQVTLNPEGNTIVAGKAVSWNGNLLEGVKDITEYDAEGNEVIPVVFVNENVSFAEEPRPDSSWLVADIKAWLDAQGIAYVGNALKADLLALV
jgi:hypothetical protein